MPAQRWLPALVTGLTVHWRSNPEGEPIEEFVYRHRKMGGA